MNERTRQEKLEQKERDKYRKEGGKKMKKSDEKSRETDDQISIIFSSFLYRWHFIQTRLDSLHRQQLTVERSFSPYL
jgi:hypothetical protein